MESVESKTRTSQGRTAAVHATPHPSGGSGSPCASPSPLPPHLSRCRLVLVQVLGVVLGVVLGTVLAVVPTVVLGRPFRLAGADAAGSPPTRGAPSPPEERSTRPPRGARYTGGGVGNAGFVQNKRPSEKVRS